MVWPNNIQDERRSTYDCVWWWWTTTRETFAPSNNEEMRTCSRCLSVVYVFVLELPIACETRRKRNGIKPTALALAHKTPAKEAYPAIGVWVCNRIESAAAATNEQTNAEDTCRCMQFEAYICVSVCAVHFIASRIFLVVCHPTKMNLFRKRLFVQQQQQRYSCSSLENHTATACGMLNLV